MKGKLTAICMAMLGMILMAEAAFGQEIQVPLVGTCINSSYVQYDTNVTIGGVSSEVKVPPSGGIYCPFGCQENITQYGADCVPNRGSSPYDLGLIAGFGVVSFILAYIALNMDKKLYGAITVLFSALSFFFLWVEVSTIRIVLEINAVTVFDPLIEAVLSAIIWTGVFFVFYLIVVFIWSLFQEFKLRKKKKAENPFGGRA